MREDAWQALTVTEIPAALAALAAFCLLVATVTQRSPAVPLAIAVVTATLGLVALVAIAVRAAALPPGASGADATGSGSGSPARSPCSSRRCSHCATNGPSGASR